jgi:hypothetical protein
LRLCAIYPLLSSDFQPVKVDGVIVQDRFLGFVVYIVAFEKFRNIALEHVRQSLVGIIRGPHQAPRIELPQHVGQGFFFNFAGGPDLAVANQLAGFLLEQWRLDAVGFSSSMRSIM